MLWKSNIVIFCVAALAAVVAPAFAQTPEDVQKITDALPKSATVKPAAKRKLLVFSLATAFKHDSIPYGEKAFELMGTATGAYEATLSRDMSVFEPENLKQFDAILMNNTSGELFTTPSLQQSLVDFVKSGKGLAGVHGAAAGCYTWPTYGDMLGGYFNGHPWNANSQVSVKIDDPSHPLTKAFGGTSFDITEEIYQFKDPFTRHKLRVLASLDNSKTDMSLEGMKRADKDFAISWVRKFGDGRVFYCSLGHNKHIFHDARVLQHYLDGIQFVLGDLEADAEPIASIALEKQNQSLDAAEAGLKGYDYGKAEPASAIFDSLTRATVDASGARRAFVARLVSVATNPQYSVAARELTLRRLPYNANENDVEPLFPLLKDSNAKIAEMTRYALGPIPGPSISKAFRDAAASSTSDTVTAGFINALGSRKDDDSVSFIAKYADDPSAVIASAAITMLGKIGSEESADALQKVFASTSETMVGLAGSALSECAGSLAIGGKPQKAIAIYQSLLQKKGSYAFRLAAFIGNANLSPKPSEVALETLLSQDTEFHSAAGNLLSTAKDDALNKKIAAAIKGQQPEIQIALLRIAATRQAREALVPARDLRDSPTTATRAQAIVTLGTIGDESVAEDLLKIAAAKGDEFAEMARTSIDKLTAPGVDDLLIRLIDPGKGGETSDEAVAEISEAIQAIGRRQVTAAVPVLLETAKLREEDSLKGESYSVLAKLARAEDARVLLDLTYQIKSQSVRTKAERALLAAISKMQPAESQSAFLVDAIEPAPSSEARVSILKLIGKLGGDNSYQALKKFLASEDKTIRDTAIRALADFSTGEPINDLIAIAQDTAAENVHKVLALRGAARMVGLESKRKRTETLELAKTLLDLAATDEDKMLVISNLAEVKQPGIIELITPSLNTEALAAETSATILKLAPHVWMFSPLETSKTLVQVMGTNLTDTQKEDLKKVTDKMDELTSAVAGWQVSGPYDDPSADDLEKLMSHKFGPESGSDSVDWKAVSVNGNSEDPEILDLEKPLRKAKNSVAYLRTYLIANGPTTASLRIGSDDGILVWLNGNEVLKASIPRDYKKADNSVTVSLTQGKNELLAKVPQVDGPWRASVIVESPEGALLPGVTVQTFPSNLN